MAKYESKRGRSPKTSHTLDLFSAEAGVGSRTAGLDWPDASRFPLNRNGVKTEDGVIEDLKHSQNPLIVTGFASLDRLIDFVADCPAETIRVLLGSEPFPSRQESYELRGYSLPREMETYWLGRGISVLLSAKLLRCIERLRTRRLLVRLISGPRLHAKIYVGDNAATVGSSNFTTPGLARQLEANVRFTDATRLEATRFNELKVIAENYWSVAQDYSDAFLALLEQLLQVVPWREALARAAAELLEGTWAASYLKSSWFSGEKELWPAQRQGIAQALYILSRQGSVLVADATGSGKTRMGVHLVRALLDQILRSGRLRQGKSVMICPPVVKGNWDWESHVVTQLDTYSHGGLSQTSSKEHALIIDAVHRTQVLCIDEGHNFLNTKTNRTQHLLRNMADHVLLFTATPINRSVNDLLRIVDMLGADNLEPSTLRTFRRMLKARRLSRKLTDEERDALRQEIQRFTVRRTKKAFNALIDQEPEKYLDKRGKRCRYPKHVSKEFSLNESEIDRQIAEKIRTLADQLHGVSHFVQPIEMPEILVKQGMSEESYLRRRLSSAKRMTRFLITVSLRSSRIALAEHIVGTTRAIEEFKLSNFVKMKSGNMLERMQAIAGKPPKNHLSIHLPAWLTEPELHAVACKHDRKRYEDIYGLLRQLTDGREREKATLLTRLLFTHPLLLAFDRRPITLAYIRQCIEQQNGETRTIVATGESRTKKGRNELFEIFQPGSTEKQVIGLCSDSLSEGANLQQASALVLLDTPSVPRIAEQRVGRIDRMDSPHPAIEVYWPNDADEFAVSSDEQFIERYDTVENLLGGNLPLPESRQKAHRVSTQQLIEEFEKEPEPSQWDGIKDAFEPVRNLVEGEAALISTTVYNCYRSITARVLSRVSPVSSQQPWAFFCVAAGVFGAPRWIVLPGFTESPVIELGDVCAELRGRLSNEVRDLDMTDHAERELKKFLNRLSEVERQLLPRRKRLALEEMELVIDRFSRMTSSNQNQEASDYYQRILDMLRIPALDHQPNWDEVAGRWLDVIRPIWYERLKQGKRQLLVLQDIRKDLIDHEEDLRAGIFEHFQSFPVMPTPDERIIAVILGVA